MDIWNVYYMVIVSYNILLRPEDAEIENVWVIGLILIASHVSQKM